MSPKKQRLEASRKRVGRSEAPEPDLAFLSIDEVARLIRTKAISPVELLEHVLARVERLNPKINAFITVLADEARRAARLAEREILRGRYRGLLHGLPISLKDNFWTRGVRTTAGSSILRDFVPDADSTVARRLARAGAILIGKTNLHEFAYGVTTENPHFGPARNPWALEHIPGGSSGGSAAAIAAGLGFGSMGTDTGGSIRIPAALCGIVGLKPTYGRVSCYGVVPLARSLDHAGPLARTVADVAVLLRAVAGSDPLDSAAARKPVPDYAAALRRRMERVRLGRPRNYFFDHVDGEVEQALGAAARELEQLGARIEDVQLPHIEDSVTPSTHLALAEATRFHQAAGYFPARAQEYGEDVRKRLGMGDEVRAVDYLAALEARDRVAEDFRSVFERVDALLAPTTPIAAPKLGEGMLTIDDEEESVRSALVRLNRSANFVGLPAISVPCGFTRAGLPIGMQIIGRAWEEPLLLRIAYAYEQATEWHTRHPRGF